MPWNSKCIPKIRPPTPEHPLDLPPGTYQRVSKAFDDLQLTVFKSISLQTFPKVQIKQTYDKTWTNNPETKSRRAQIFAKVSRCFCTLNHTSRYCSRAWENVHCLDYSLRTIENCLRLFSRIRGESPRKRWSKNISVRRSNSRKTEIP